MLVFDGHVYDAVVREQLELTVCQVIREVVNVDQEQDGPRTAPCGTPDVTGTVDDDFPSITTVCVRLVRKAEIQ
jgi:hypothetical protein